MRRLAWDALTLLGPAAVVISTVYRKSDQAAGVDFSRVELLGAHPRFAALMSGESPHAARRLPFVLIPPRAPTWRTLTERNYSFHRAELQQTMINELGPAHAGALRLGKRFVSYTAGTGTGRIQLAFEDGTSATCDVLVGADGIRSGVRAAMFSQLAAAAREAGCVREAEALQACVAPVFSGEVVYRCLVKRESLPPEVAALPALSGPVLCLVSWQVETSVEGPVITD